MSEPDRSRFAALPEGPRPEEWVETTDTAQRPTAPERDGDAVARAVYLGGPLP
ncbi:hypothetical protein [Klenkia brasiliensis]|uniref:Uncharacterized protein n=1 Tax=Klenkia brasiliensis TaxID=333142 RepID=A0A1G7UM56_9ACTN|nr:hypothetical protein [Klenkia brasiliensis]SDG48567.1 hypothetical protein SAMN05660324_2690 [Klenkia brasiliensis]